MINTLSNPGIGSPAVTTTVKPSPIHLKQKEVIKAATASPDTAKISTLSRLFAFKGVEKI